MSTTEISFHDLRDVKIENQGDNWFELVLVNSNGESIAISIFSSRRDKAVFNALKMILNTEFNPVADDAEARA